MLRRGVAKGGDFDSLADIQRLLAADPEYAGKVAILCELVHPARGITIASKGFGRVHSLDIVTLRTKAGKQTKPRAPPTRRLSSCARLKARALTPICALARVCALPGVRVLTCLLWTDCDTWSSHSCQAGYLIDVRTETIVAPASW